MQRTKPPFRADHVGSLLRTAALKEARGKRERGEITAEALKPIEDREIEGVIKKQEAVGLKSITDGEYRRLSWNLDFLERLHNVESYVGERKIKFNTTGPQPRPILLRVIGKLGGYQPHPMIEHFKFLEGAHQADAEDDHPVAVVAAFPLRPRRGAGIDLSRHGRVLSRSRPVLPQGGARLRRCRLPLSAARRGQSHLSVRPVAAQSRSAIAAKIRRRCPRPMPTMINAAISDIPPDMTITMHLCRGNFRSNFVASGGYEPVAELLFNAINVHGYFMEYDTDRAGGFEPLRFVPKGKTVVLGLVTSKTGTLESKDDIKRRIDQATKFIPLDQLCLSPQCGFASTEEGNVLAEDEQWAKLRMIVELADEVWGK